MHESSPLFVDLDGDNVLDYFNSLHGHRIVNETGSLNNRMELAFTRNDDGSSGQYLDPFPGLIIIEDDPTEFTAEDIFFIDPHGQNIVDLVSCSPVGNACFFCRSKLTHYNIHS